MNKKLSKTKGFTLIELLVVVSIIGFLSSIVLTNLTQARVKARNARIRLDVKQIINALYLARDSDPAGKFPGVLGNYQCLKSSGTCFIGNYSGNTTITNALAPFISTIPKPPSPPFGSGTYMFDSYVYAPHITTGPFGGPPGTYLIWAQEGVIRDCKGTLPIPNGPLEGNNYYCFEYLGAN